MKRYWAYYGDIHYPIGGYWDFINYFDTKEEAVDAVIEICKRENVNTHDKDGLWHYNWAHVLDAETKEIVWGSD